MITVVVVLVVAVAVVGFIRFRRYMTGRLEKVTIDILVELSRSKKGPHNVTELIKTTGHPSPMIINALKYLHRHDCVSSNQPKGVVYAATDTARFSINNRGRAYLQAYQAKHS